jgi:hypothetical protein
MSLAKELLEIYISTSKKDVVNYAHSNESMGMNIPQKTYQYQIVTSVSNSTSIQRY